MISFRIKQFLWFDLINWIKNIILNISGGIFKRKTVADHILEMARLGLKSVKKNISKN